jgi:hypothetical protein
MVMSELEWALQQDLDPQERRLFQGLHAAAAEEVQDLRAYLDAEGALHTMAARSGHGPRPAARAQEVVTD